MSQAKVKRKRADWNDKNLELFLKVCVQEVRAGNRPHTHFNKMGWANIQTKFNNATKSAYEYKMLKNKWDHLKVDWASWTKLKAYTGLGWDAAKGTVAASDEWWEAKIKENPNLQKFRDEGLKFPPEMEFLFRGIVATGLAAYAPSEDSRDSHGPSIGVEESCDNDIDNETETEMNGIEIEMTSEPTSSRGNGQRKRGRDGEKKVGVAAKLSSQLERIINSFESSDPASKTGPANITACIERLKNLPGLTRGSDLFYTGISLMNKRENRLIFLDLEEPTLQLGWIKSKHK